MPSASPTSSNGRPKRSLSVLFSVIILDLIGFGIVVPILPLYSRDLDASPLVLGFLLAIYPAFQFLLSPVWGRVSDRLGRRPVMLATMAGSVVALTLLGFADSIFWLFAGRALGGVFGANISVATAYIADVTDEAERTRWMGMVGASFGIGFVLGPAIGGLLCPNLEGGWPAGVVFGEAISARLEPLGYGIPMLVAAGMTALNFLYALWALDEPRRHVNREPPQGRREVLRNPVIRRLCLVNLTFGLAVTQLESIFPLLMLERFQFGQLQITPFLVGMAILMGGVQGGAIGPLAARFGDRKLVLSGYALLGISFTAVPFMGSAAWLVVPLAVSAVGRGIGQPPMMSLISRAATPETRGAVMGTFQSSASLSRIFGPIAAGALFGVSQKGPFLLAGVLMLTAFIIARRLPRDR